MTFKEYLQLDENNQYYYWLGSSTQVASYKKSGSHFILYQLYSFYIQLSFSPSDPRQALFQSFEDTKLLAPYLEVIDISGVCFK